MTAGDPTSNESSASPEASTAPAESTHRGAVGTLIATYALVDAYLVGIPVMGLAAWGQPLVVAVVTAVLMIVVNIAACTWIDDQWGGWVEDHPRIGKKLDKASHGKFGDWVTRSSLVWMGLAAVLLNAIGAVALARLLGGKSVGRPRIVVAAVSYSIFFAVLFSAIGYALGDVIRAL